MKGLIAACVMVSALAASSKPPNEAKACAPPRISWQKPHCIECGLESPRISYEIDHNSKIYQDGKPISLTELSKRLGQIGQIDNPRIQVHLEIEAGADCSTIETVRNLFEQHLDCSEYGQCAEG